MVFVLNPYLKRDGLNTLILFSVKKMRNSCSGNWNMDLTCIVTLANSCIPGTISFNTLSPKSKKKKDNKRCMLIANYVAS